MPKHPETKNNITRLLTEAGYVNENGRIQRARFCADTGINADTLDKWIRGEVSISITKIQELCTKLSISFNIIYSP